MSVWVQVVLGLAAVGGAAFVLALVVRRVAAGDRERASEVERREAHQMRLRASTRLPGATPDRAIEVASPAAVEARAQALPCPACGGRCHVEEHIVQEHGGVRLRVANMHCSGCGGRRPVYLQLRATPLVN